MSTTHYEVFIKDSTAVLEDSNFKSGTSIAGYFKKPGDPKEHEVVLHKLADGSIAAFSSICTHRGCPVDPTESEFLCPCHGSKFDLTTGAVLHGPAHKPLTQLEVSVESGHLMVGEN